LRRGDGTSRTLAQSKASITPAKSFDEYNLILNDRASEFIDRRTKINVGAKMAGISAPKAMTSAGS
jgi:hypothetical protein